MSAKDEVLDLVAQARDHAKENPELADKGKDALRALGSLFSRMADSDDPVEELRESADFSTEAGLAALEREIDSDIAAIADESEAAEKRSKILGFFTAAARVAVKAYLGV